ncbi:helix-turn-helix protein [Nocardiopsis sp. Huas11]|uniref:AraC family transcriptional regulator ligand-binding domain-containing protein n=1 Tax=Nocardiopsis sp. Huas11 TaxID=2183912 RepID=UPI000EB47648|nr:AraC family transcriptional regulator ligand-binding domain-containing protein [Nocardiopsis sp. Huas11]RKS06450.1 helix-turn-helix protein [Nocardiopsis sp. Huas11]
MTEFRDRQADQGRPTHGSRSGDGHADVLASVVPSPRLEGTTSTCVTRFLAGQVSRTGGDPGKVACLPDARTDVLSDDFSRVPTDSANAMLRYLVAHNPAPSRGGAPQIATPPPGALGVWDYMLTSGPTIMDSIRSASRYIGVVADPGVETFEGVEDGELYTIRHSTCPYEQDVKAAVELWVLALLLRRCREATGIPLVPVRVGLQQRAPRSHGTLLDLFGTSRVDFDAPVSSLTFLTRDVRRPFPNAQFGLQEMLGRHAAMMMAAAKPVLDWHDVFRLSLHACFETGSPALETVARELRISSRTLQRRLAERGSTWRDEVETVREEKALSLLRDGRIPMKSIAGRVGYSDVRALRRAVRRWESRPAEPSGIGTE